MSKNNPVTAVSFGVNESWMDLYIHRGSDLKSYGNTWIHGPKNKPGRMIRMMLAVVLFGGEALNKMEARMKLEG